MKHKIALTLLWIKVIVCLIILLPVMVLFLPFYLWDKVWEWAEEEAGVSHEGSVP